MTTDFETCTSSDKSQQFDGLWHSQWQKYEILKKEIYNKNLSPEEYEAEIKKAVAYLEQPSSGYSAAHLKEIEVENGDTV